MKILKLQLLLITICLLLSCSNEQFEANGKVVELEIQTIQNATLQEKNQYKKNHLLKLANLINDNYSNTAFKNHLLSKSDDHASGKTFFIEDLLKMTLLNADISTSASKSLNAFKNLDGKNWKPTITVYDKRAKNLKRTSENLLNPLYFFSESETNIERLEFPAYETTGINGNLVYTEDYNVEETIGKIYFVIDIGIEDPSETDPTAGVVPPGFISPNFNPGLIRMHKMKIRNGKEDWINGDSEVHLVGFITEPYPSSNGFCGDFMQGAANCNNATGQRIDQIPRRWINNLHEYNYIFHNFNSAGSSTGSILNYVIFEEDTWPNPIHSKTFAFPNGVSRTINYQSGQSPFDDRQLSRDLTLPFFFAGNFVGNNSDIYYIMHAL